MKWNETVASRCRYGDVAERVFGEAEIIWEHSEDDWQGSANLLAKMPDGRFAHYEWTYGSCSGCDTWEASGMTDDAIEAEMRQTTAWFDNAETLCKYLHLEAPEQPYPSSKPFDEGGLYGMLRIMSGGVSTEFREMSEAFAVWLQENTAGESTCEVKQ